MRIAILCNGRSGSTSTFYYLKCCLARERKKYDYLFEPFNYIKEHDNFQNAMMILNKKYKFFTYFGGVTGFSKQLFLKFNVIDLAASLYIRL